MVAKGVVVGLIVFFCLSSVSASLGITPAKKEFVFEPGKEIVLSYTVYSDNPEQVIGLYVGGFFAEHTTLSVEELVGGGSFTATIRLPETALPGPHRLSVSARERPPENVFIGTVIDISGVVDIFVPYPGRYLEGTLTIPHANAGEDIPVEVSVANRGIEPLTVAPVISFFSSSEEDSRRSLVHTMTFTPVEVPSGATQFYRKFLSTDSSLPGAYFAEAVVDYGQKLVLNQSFRIGSAFVRYLNHTSRLPQEGLQRFNISVTSEWNDDFESVYADITLSSEGTVLTSFRTPPITLPAWQSGYLEAYIDTDALSLGAHEVALTLHYGEELSTHTGTLEIYSPPLSPFLIWGSVAGIAVILLALLLIRMYNHRKHKRYKAHVRRTHRVR